MRRAHTIAEMKAVAASRGGKCLSIVYVNNQTKLRWRCSSGHEWEATAQTILKGKWCPECYGNKPGNLAKMRQVAADRGGKCLSKKYVNSRTKLLWRCAEKHEWEAPPNRVKKGSWCPVCAKSAHTIAEMRGLARDRGGRCLSKIYYNMETKLLWRCAKGHEWETTPGTVIGGSWCPTCSRKNRKKPAKRLSERQETKARKKARLQRAKKHLKVAADLAAAREGLCLTKRLGRAGERVRWECGEGHNWVALVSSVKAGSWCPDCARARAAAANKGTIEQMQALAARNGGKCISTEYVNSRSKLLWRCRYDHEWEALPTDITQGHWCARCAGQKKTIEQMRKLADERGGECLSAEYVNNYTKLLWRCGHGHEWWTKPAVIQMGCWCPVCARASQNKEISK